MATVVGGIPVPSTSKDHFDLNEVDGVRHTLNNIDTVASFNSTLSDRDLLAGTQPIDIDCCAPYEPVSLTLNDLFKRGLPLYNAVKAEKDRRRVVRKYSTDRLNKLVKRLQTEGMSDASINDARFRLMMKLREYFFDTEGDVILEHFSKIA
ncbi:hypothetical protein H0H93_006955 [Arthromyces matolae]|nr:hypothetical protein H0H93_006955 [Arthromyces matolae]